MKDWHSIHTRLCTELPRQFKLRRQECRQAAVNLLYCRDNGDSKHTIRF
jgi:hypothetical protein